MKPIIWSYGGGVQTIAILTLIADGKLSKPDLAIMADTGRERSSTWRYFSQYAKPILEGLSIPFEVASHDLATVDLYTDSGELLIPAFTNSGKLSTFCSDKWKKMVCRRRLRQLGYGPDNPITLWFGMSLDEFDRVRHSGKKWIDNYYPLIFDYKLRRHECAFQIQRFGLPIPFKSACVMCPHLNNEEWLEMIKNDPDDFHKAVVLDRLIRSNDTRGGLYLHRSMLPLDQVDFSVSSNSAPLFECSDSCWT